MLGRHTLCAMTSTVRDLFASVGLTPIKPVRWGTAPTSDRPGVYVVATTDDLDEPNGSVAAPIAALPAFGLRAPAGFDYFAMSDLPIYWSLDRN